MTTDGTPSFDFNGQAPLPTAATSHDSNRAALPGTALLDSSNGSSPGPSKLQTNGAPPNAVLDAHGRVLNPRSCVTCRRRKVKCDKSHPCANCQRAHIDCVYPTPGRAPRRPRKPVDTRESDLLDRLRRLEGVVKGLGVDVGPATEGAGDGAEGEQQKSHDGSVAGHSPHSETRSARQSMDGDGQIQNGQERSRHRQLENRFGRLVVSEGRSRYVNTSFWASLSNEVEDLKGILNDDSDEEEDATPGSTHHGHGHGHHHGWMFGFSSQSVDMLSLHPTPVQIETYWSIYLDRVDPLAKVLHVPSITPTILTSATHLANLSKGFEALLFSIYYGAVTSLSPDECLSRLGEDRSLLLSRYRFGVEQALARANFLTAEELVILQAFVTFLMCLRRNNDARVIWTLTGLLVRMAQTVGIHRDGTHFGLPVFEIEMRRRLWWQICILDVRASEDHGCDPTIVESIFDTKMPLNINDVDISPTTKEFPAERKGCTDMSFCLIRYEVANTFRRLNYIPPGQRCNEIFASVTRQQKEKWIQDCHDMLEEKYLKHCDMTVPLYWVTATVARLMMSKMWLIVYHPYQRTDGGASITDEIKDKLFTTSLENIEYAILLETETRTMKWGWLFKTYMQWHALAFLLTELCKRTSGPLVDRAWSAVNKVRDGRWGEINENGRSSYLWRPLERLHAKACKARQEALKKPPSNTDAFAADSPSGQIIPGSVLDIMSRQGSRSNTSSFAPDSTTMSSSSSPAAFGSAMLTSIKLFNSPRSTTIDHNNTNGPRRVDPTGTDMTSSCATDTSNQPLAPSTLQKDSQSYNWPTSEPGVTMNSQTSPFDTNGAVALGPLQDPTATEDVNMTFDANGELDWANFDNMVRQFGMDVDAPPVKPGQAAQWTAPNWNSIGNTPGMGMGAGDWF